MKNLEEAYKKSQQEEIPDLWARIEEKLPEKKKKKKIISITRYLGVAAAALFLCILIPGVLRIAGGAKSADSSNEMAYDTAANFENADAASQYTIGTTDDGMEEAVSEGAEEENIGIMDSASGSMDNNIQSTANTPLEAEEKDSQSDGMPAEDMEIMEDMSEADFLVGSDTVGSDTVGSDAETATNDSYQAETLQENLTVQEILQTDEDKILVLSATDGTTFRAQLPDNISFTFVIGESYDFTLEKQAGVDWEYVVLDAG